MAGNVVEELIKSIQQEPKKQSRAVAAVVARVDGEGVVWVRLAGSEQETPTASVSAEVKPGDVVTVEWRNKKLYIAGNYSNPSAGIQRILITEANMNAANNLIGTFDKKVDNLMRITSNTTQYFWHTETGTDTGAHITEIPKDNFLEDPENGGSNLLARSNGIAVRYGLAELAMFSANGIQIGQSGQTRAVIGSNSLRLMSKEGSTYFHVSDLRNIGDNVEESFTSNGASSNYTLTCAPDEPSERNTVVTVNGVPQKWGIGADSDYPYVISFHVGRYPFGLLEFTDAIPPGGADIVVRYPPLEVPIAFTFGSRASGFPIGDISAVIGRNCEASWPCSFAQGLETKTGDECQAVFGTYNDPSDGLLVIGNGTGDSNRSNALTVDWNGNLNCAGSITSAAGSSTRFTFSSNVSGAVNPLAYGYKDNVAKTVRIYFMARYNSNVASGTTIFTVPEGYRPSVNSPVMVAIRMEDGSMNPAYLTINTSGAIVQNFTSFCRGIVGHAEYSI